MKVKGVNLKHQRGDNMYLNYIRNLEMFMAFIGFRVPVVNKSIEKLDALVMMTKFATDAINDMARANI